MTKKLRSGYTTGTCAAAAAAAAVRTLLSGSKPESVDIVTPNGKRLILRPKNFSSDVEYAECSVQKDSGDDPDVTDGLHIFARVRCIPHGIEIDGGDGIGRVTRRGLDRQVGEAAINSVPRKMIAEAVSAESAAFGYEGGISVIISAPGGAEIAKKTFNPRLGIEGGISILGTTGIVEPMSEKALVDTIYLELKMKREGNANVAVLTPGNYGESFCREQLNIQSPVLCGNFVGDAIDMAGELGFSGILIVSHIGKLAKLGSGIMNTHSKYADGRMETLALCAALADVPEWRRVLDCTTTCEAYEIIRDTKTIDILMDRIDLYLRRRTDKEIGAVMYIENDGLIGMTPSAQYLAEKASKQI